VHGGGVCTWLTKEIEAAALDKGLPELPEAFLPLELAQDPANLRAT
jgi:hypothetical protein